LFHQSPFHIVAFILTSPRNSSNPLPYYYIFVILTIISEAITCPTVGSKYVGKKSL